MSPNGSADTDASGFRLWSTMESTSWMPSKHTLSNIDTYPTTPQPPPETQPAQTPSPAIHPDATPRREEEP